MTEATKTIAVKMVGSGRPIESRLITPGTTVRDLLVDLGLQPAGFQLSDSKGTQIYNLSDNLFALCEDGQLLMASALVDAGGV